MAFGDLSPENPYLNEDAFGRLRVSELRNIFEWQFRYDSSFDIYWSESNLNSATQSLDTDRKARKLTGAAASGSKAILQTRRRIEYTPGKSQLCKFTFNLNGKNAEFQKCIGLYDDDNGLFLRLNGTTPELVIRSKGTGSVVERVFTQSNWNIDKLDGTGESGKTLDFTCQQLFLIDYAYLGTGNIRFYFYIDGKPILVHSEENANIQDRSYMQSGILPVRAEIVAVGTPTASDDMFVGCVAVATEGKDTLIGRVRNGSTGTNAISFGVNETFGFAIRIKDIYNYSSVRAQNFEVQPVSGNAIGIYRVYYNPTLTGATWADNPSSITQAVTNSPSFSGGLVIATGYLSLSGGNNKADSTIFTLNPDIYLGFDLSNTSDILMITLQSDSGNASAYFSGNWREVF